MAGLPKVAMHKVCDLRVSLVAEIASCWLPSAGWGGKPWSLSAFMRIVSCSEGPWSLLGSESPSPEWSGRRSVESQRGAFRGFLQIWDEQEAVFAGRIGETGPLRRVTKVGHRLFQASGRVNGCQVNASLA